MKPDQLMQEAQHSKFALWKLNKAINYMIPFNKPHGFKILELSDREVTTFIPYKKRNFNHIRGLHATALATLSEFTTGLLLLRILGSRSYRIILQRLDIQYHYQGKMSATAKFKVDDDWLKQHIYGPLEAQDSVVAPCPVEIYDEKDHKLTSATIYWQLKPWDKVKTKV